MRRFALLTSCVFAFSFNANAQSILGTGGASEWGQLTSWAMNRAEQAKQLKQLYDQYVMAERTWNAVAGARDVGGMMDALGGPTRRFLPDAGGLVDGVGQGSRLVGGAGGVRSANQIFSAIPQATRSAENGARWLEEMNRREVTTANVQQTANQALQDVESRIARLGVMQARIAMSDDIKDIETVKASIAVEQQNLALHSASMQALQLKLAAADRMESARQEQVAAEGSKRWADATRSAIDRLQGD